MKALHIAPGLSLPAEAQTQTFAVLAKRGVGKTYLASVLAEEMAGAGLRFAVLDPVGVWWGLLASADGKGPGIPVYVLGGEHGHIALPPTSGVAVAETVVAARESFVLDLSLMRKGEMVRFLTDFCEALYRLNRDPLHLFMDEADAFAPQRCPPGPALQLLGAVEDLVRRGRARGLGMTLITQRAAVLNKDVLTQVEVLVAMRTIGPQDRAAIETWIDAHGDEAERDELLASLASLEIGEAWVWSPAWLRTLKRVRVRRRETFDSSATPKAGERRSAPKALAVVDLPALEARLASTAEAAKANDPRALRAELARLKAELAKRPEVRPAKASRVVERSVLKDAHVARLEALAVRLAKAAGALNEAATVVGSALRAATGALGGRVQEPARSHSRPIQARPQRPRSAVAPSPGATSGGPLGKGERAVLTAVAQHDAGVTREQLTVLTGYKRSSRDTYLQRLRVAGYVEDGDVLRATQAGVDALGDGFEPLPTGAELLEHHRRRLPAGERKILDVLVTAYPDAVEREALSEATGYQRSSRDTYLQRLRSRQLVTEPGRGTVRAADLLFDAPVLS